MNFLLDTHIDSHSTCTLKGVKLLASDFDGTITKKDTTWLALQASERYLFGTNEEQCKLLKIWNQHGKHYFAGYKKLLNDALDSHVIDSNVFDLKGLEILLHKIDCYNHQQSLKLAKHHIFDDMVQSTFPALSKAVEFQPGFLRFNGRLNAEKQVSIHIISLNWMQGLVHSTLRGNVPTSNIHTGVVPKLVHHTSALQKSNLSTAFDKRQMLQNFSKESKTPGLVIYVGDSIADLLALLAADVGFIIKGSRTILDVCQHFGIKVLPTGSYPTEGENTPRQMRKGFPFLQKRKALYLADSWSDIEMVIFNLNSAATKESNF